MIGGYYSVDQKFRANDVFELRQFFREHPELWGKASVRYVAIYTVPESVMHAVEPHDG